MSEANLVAEARLPVPRFLRGPMIASFAATLLLGCSDMDGRNPTGSQSMVASADYGLLYVANVDNASVSRLDPASGEVQTGEVGSEPTRIARAGERLFVTLRAERAVTVLDSELRSVGRIDVGAEPVGIVASVDGARVYVASSLSGRVDEIDTASLTIVRSFEVADEPRWLAIHPSGSNLFVASAFRGTLTRIELQTGRVNTVSLPAASSMDFRDGSSHPLSIRLTGDLAVSPDGETLAVPAMYVDNETVVVDGTIDEAPSGYDAGRFNPVVALVPLEDDGVPASDPIDLVRVSGFDQTGPLVGYLASVSFSPDAARIFSTVEGASTVLAMSREQEEPSRSVFDVLFGGGSEDVAMPGPMGPSFNFRSAFAIRTQAGPRSIVAVSDELAYVYSFMDRTVAAIDLSRVERELEHDGDGDELLLIESGMSLDAASGLEVAPLAIPADVDQGRRLFYSVADGRMASSGAGVSCATCHFDGRDDGLVWSFSRGPRQTPSLAGKVSLTAPVGWQGQQESVASDARATSQDLMGGSGLSQIEVASIAAYVDWTRDLDLPRSSDDPAAARGKAIFERSDVACSTCHTGPRYSDNQLHAVRGVEMKTRPLANIAATAPYFHDGSAATLEQVVRLAQDGREGSTAMLDDAEIKDLVAYLETL
ncbi:MAG: c-type cytochrome [Deltaproteobacteria bacterium]|nr:c-type cytochrome [Deltaproteobacteria bacterium]